jgi:hypothetical protein
MFPEHPSPPRIVIAGVGNVSAGIDPFATELVRALTHVKWPEGVRVADYGLRQVDLTYTLAEEADVAILVDTVSHGKPPGTMEVVRPDTDDLAHNSDKPCWSNANPRMPDPPPRKSPAASRPWSTASAPANQPNYSRQPPNPTQPAQ